MLALEGPAEEQEGSMGIQTEHHTRMREAETREATEGMATQVGDMAVAHRRSHHEVDGTTIVAPATDILSPARTPHLPPVNHTLAEADIEVVKQLEVASNTARITAALRRKSTEGTEAMVVVSIKIAEATVLSQLEGMAGTVVMEGRTVVEGMAGTVSPKEAAAAAAATEAMANLAEEVTVMHEVILVSYYRNCWSSA